MSFVYYNPNPERKYAGDCVVRAVSKFFGYDWTRSYMELCIQGAKLYDWGLVNDVWSSYLEEKGLIGHPIEDTCPYCYTLKHFCFDHPRGRYFLSMDVGYGSLFTMADSGKINGNHVVTVVDGDYYDAWDSGNEVPIYYWEERKEKQL